MSSLKVYVRKMPFYVKARRLASDEVVYDGQGQVIRFEPGDYLIELETDRYKMSADLFEQLYTEVKHDANGIHQDVPQTESPDLREC